MILSLYMSYKPPFSITPRILTLSSEIQHQLGQMSGIDPSLKPSVKLRKENRIRTIHNSLAIEGNTITEKQITAILQNKKVIGPAKQILEVTNAIFLYDQLDSFNPFKEKEILRAHSLLMNGLDQSSGRYRPGAVGIFKGNKLSKMSPPAKQVPILMAQLFAFLKNEKELSLLIKACIFHYELEFIHPFSDGNGRMGRLWQQLILMKHDPIFESIAVESEVHKNQKRYYLALETSDKNGDSAAFVEFCLESITNTLKHFISDGVPARITFEIRIQKALDHFSKDEFSRKDYIGINKGISTATASRDLEGAVKLGLIKRTGTKAQSMYRRLKSLK